MTDLDGSQIKQIHSALKSAFPTEGDLEKLLTFTFNETIANIGQGDNYNETLLKVIRWAQAQGQLEELLRGAYAENPRNTQLRAIITTLVPGDVQAQPDNPPTIQPERLHPIRPILIVLGVLTILLLALSGYMLLKQHQPPVLPPPTATPVPTEFLVNGLTTLGIDTTHTIFLNDGWDGAWLLPDSLDPTQDPSRVFDWLKQRASKPDTLAPLQAFEGFSYYLRITNAFSSTEWLRLDSNESAAVSVSQPPRALFSSVYSVGGGGGSFRFFPSVPLLQGTGFYTRKVKQPDFNYFELQPGEFEEFIFFFKCAAPGTYIITLELPYAYSVEFGKIIRASPQLICPNSYILWRTDYPNLSLEGTYIWDGTAYNHSP